MAFRGCGEGEVDGKRLRAREGLAAEGDLTEDDREPERLLGVVVGRRHARDLKEGKEIVTVALRVGDPLPQVLRLGVCERSTADFVTRPPESRDVRFGGEKCYSPAVPSLADAATKREELVECLAEVSVL